MEVKKRLEGLLGRYGITRVANLTQLDVIGLPVLQAIRPAARTLKVSSGRGLRLDEAWISAVMESLELWHSERVVAAEFYAPINEVDDLAYDPCWLAQEEVSVLHGGSVLGWIRGRLLGANRPTWVPRGAVALDFSRAESWHPASFFVSSTGLGAGSTQVQATIHAALEVIERDAVSRALTGEGPRPTRVSLESLGHSVVGSVLDLLHRAGARLIVEAFVSPTGLPVFGAVLTCPDYPLLTSGYGCDLDPEVAVIRALTEAIQTRTTYVSGARDDLPQSTYDHVDPHQYAQLDRPPLLDADPVDAHAPRRRDKLEDLEVIVERCIEAFGSWPILVDLAHGGSELAFVRVLMPGARLVQGAV